jgi:serine/threonine-protein kinase
LCGTREGDVVKILDFGSVKDKNKDAKKLTVLGTTIGSPYYMAPEQAQGLETLDARADVFALAAIAYECMCGSVPFPGNNGPSILLAILTKDPDPPSLSAPKAKFHIPPKMDDVMEEALAKNPNIRTKSVGALADAFGAAYGLAGDHRQWAKTPAAVLAQQVAEAKERVMSAPRAPAAVEVAADPFASPPQQQQGWPQQQQQPYGQRMDQAFAQVSAQQSPVGDFHGAYAMAPAMGAAGVPAKTNWVVPVILGALVLMLVGGGVVIFAFFMR